MTEREVVTEHMVATHQVVSPEQLNIAKPVEWLKWVHQFEKYQG